MHGKKSFKIFIVLATLRGRSPWLPLSWIRTASLAPPGRCPEALDGSLGHTATGGKKGLAEHARVNSDSLVRAAWSQPSLPSQGCFNSKKAIIFQTKITQEPLTNQPNHSTSAPISPTENVKSVNLPLLPGPTRVLHSFLNGWKVSHMATYNLRFLILGHFSAPFAAWLIPGPYRSNRSLSRTYVKVHGRATKDGLSLKRKKRGHLASLVPRRRIQLLRRVHLPRVRECCLGNGTLWLGVHSAFGHGSLLEVLTMAEL